MTKRKLPTATEETLVSINEDTGNPLVYDYLTGEWQSLLTIYAKVQKDYTISGSSVVYRALCDTHAVTNQKRDWKRHDRSQYRRS